jgi:preprotein translocase subunit SecF
MAKFSGLGGRLYRGETSVDFIGKRKIWYSISGLLILASAITLFTQGLHLGIEFKGGSSFTVTSTNASIQTAENALNEAGITTQTIVQKIGNDKVRVQTDALTSVQQSAVEAQLATKFNVSVDSIDSGPLAVEVLEPSNDIPKLSASSKSSDFDLSLQSIPFSVIASINCFFVIMILIINDYSLFG